MAASDDCIKIIGLDGSLQYMSEGGKRVMEVEDFEALTGCPWPDFWQGQGNVDVIAAIEQAGAGGNARFSGYADTAKGNLRFWDVKVSPIFADDGTVESILSVSRDITFFKEFEAEQRLLRNELAHRIKNIIALVQSLVNQTLKEDADIIAAKSALLARLAVLGRAQDILMQSAQDISTLQALADTTAATHPAGRITASGPHIALSSKSNLAIALALHELATNAAKYGALSNTEGHVAIAWTIETVDETDKLTLRWEERGGPNVIAPTKRAFGSRMIEKALTAYVKGSVEISYPPTGVIFRLTTSVADLAAK